MISAAHAIDTSALLAVLDADDQQHSSAQRQLSLVDCASFDAMRRLGISTASTFDRHFDEQGFQRVRPA